MSERLFAPHANFEADDDDDDERHRRVLMFNTTIEHAFRLTVKPEMDI